MKKILFAILVLSILIVSGCKAPEEAGVTVAPTTGTPTVREVSTGQEAVIKGPALTQELKTLLAKANTVDSIEYFYKEAEKGGQYYVMGNNMKIVFPMKRQVERTNMHYDSVYVDLVKKTAVGYCEVDGDCPILEEDQPREVDFNDFYTETPFDILDAITSGEKESEETIEGKKAIIIKVPLSSVRIQRVWVWDYKGIPLRYTIEDEEGNLIKKVDYTGLSANTVKMSDVTK
ncbi:hypothetical protein KY331_00765 [Candidatus Woesearchaeota archaeon]|nr:hypothetical protein [Candidatus Woesearchaeota archaeon]